MAPGGGKRLGICSVVMAALLLVAFVPQVIQGGECAVEKTLKIQQCRQINARMLDGDRVKEVRFTHPLWNESLLTGLGGNPIMGYAADAFNSQNVDALTGEGMIRIRNRYRFTLEMGSMRMLCLAGPSS